LTKTATAGEQTFRALFDAHIVFVWHVLRRHGVAERDLSDGCQEVFLVLHRRLAEFEGRSSLKTFLYGVAKMTALNMRRRARRSRELVGVELPELGSDPLQPGQLERARYLTWIEQALTGLTADQREVFVLYELEGMSMAEVAQALGVPENTALSRLYKARELIRASVERRAKHPPLRASGLGKVLP
jgi:RNA polymerase sigma-70 factor (ECF subfamily)